MCRLQKNSVAVLVALTSFALLAFAGCNNDPEPIVESFAQRSIDQSSSAQLTHSGTSNSGRFEPVSDSGITFENKLKPENEVPYLTNGAGVAVGDYDNNGLPDIFFSGQDVPNRLYRQISPFKFEDVTELTGVGGGDKIASGATFADVNNDGFLDLYVCNYLTGNDLYINLGNGQFKESSAEFQLDISEPTTMAAFMDYDRDGDLDVYLANNRRYRQEQEQHRYKTKSVNGKIVAHPSMFFELEGRMVRTGHEDCLLRNDDGKFVKANSEAGIQGFGMGLSATWWDYNNDGWPDLWVCNDLKSPDHLYINQKDGTFKDILPEITSYTTWNSMGSDFADFNNDGLFDFFVADMSATSHYKSKKNMGDMNTQAWFLETSEPRQFMRNCLYLNSGSGRLKETAFMSGVARTDWTWSVKCADLDCDGFNDIFATNGMVDNSMDADFTEEYRKLVQAGKVDEAKAMKAPRLIEENIALRNTNGLNFEKVGEQWNLNLESISHGAALADFDGDGDLDIVVNNYDQPATIYRNELERGNSLLVSLHGKKSNRFGLGSRIELHTSTGVQHRMMSPTRGYMSSDAPVVHFGLPQDCEIEKLVVLWPSGAMQVVDDVKANEHYQIAESSLPNQQPKEPKQIDKWFAQANAVSFIHRESDFDDFDHQLLLPNQLSTQGPGLAWADANGDSHLDCFIGGAAGQSGQLFVHTDGRFVKTNGPWSEHAASEDMSAAWIDVDSDNDMDLYVASGSNEFDEGDERFRDRLYINDGNGQFEDGTKAWLPDIRECSSVVSAADFDQDGKIDLFVGSRMQTRKYPLRSKSKLLKNTGTSFVDATDEFASAIKQLRLVTSATWADINNDSWMDLVVCSEWGPVSIYENADGKLVDKTQQYGLSELLGWWNGVTVADFDNNGFVDIVATNFGLNTKYGHPSVKKPLHLYYGDFDENGSIDIVEAKTDKDQGLLPVRGKSCSCHQIPSLHEKFPTYHEFAIAGLDELYELEEGDELKCNCLTHMLLKNNGNGSFDASPLPLATQIAPSFGSVASDFDGDGNLDLYVLQNFYGPQIETGRMSGGLSVMLQGNGDGSFVVISEDESNLIVPGDPRAVSVCDFNHDNRPDLVGTLNNGLTLNFVNEVSSQANFLRLSLTGDAGNPLAVGSSVTVAFDDQKRTFQFASNSGYLTQAANDLFLGLGQYSGDVSIAVRWPDGETSEVQTKSDAGFVKIAHPKLSSDLAGTKTEPPTVQ